MPFNCEMLAQLRALLVAATLFVGAMPMAYCEPSAIRLEHLHRTSTSITHVMSTAQLLGQAMATRAIGRPDEQFRRELAICQNLAQINFGEARWRLQALNAPRKLEELGYSERLFEILLEAARQWDGSDDEAFAVIEALGVLSYQLEKLSAGLGQMSDEELAALLQQTSAASPLISRPVPQASASASTTRARTTAERLPLRPHDTTDWRFEDQNL